jgi:hypothetical protein
MQDKLTDFIKQNPGNGWIQARGFNEAMMKEKRMPTKEDLNKITTGRTFIYYTYLCPYRRC